MRTRFNPSRGVTMAMMAGLVMALAGPVAATPAGGKHKAARFHHCGPMGGMMSRISVTGNGEAQVVPDMATIQLGVTTQAQTAAAAMQQNSERQNSVIEALKKSGIDPADIQTSGLNLNPLMNYPEQGAPTVTGYLAANSVSVRVTELDKLGTVLDEIVAVGANEINGISFQREESAETEDEARRLAVENAQHKAEVMAEAAGVTLGPILTIRDSQAPTAPQPMMMRAEMAKDSSVPIEAGTLSLTSQVQIEYALNDADAGADCGRSDQPVNPEEAAAAGDDASDAGPDAGTETPENPSEPPATN